MIVSITELSARVCYYTFICTNYTLWILRQLRSGLGRLIDLNVYQLLSLADKWDTRCPYITPFITPIYKINLNINFVSLLWQNCVNKLSGEIVECFTKSTKKYV